MNEHWHIVGIGAIGCLFADALACAGCDITLVGRPSDSRSSALISIDGLGGHRQHRFELTNAAGQSAIDRLLVTTKAQDASTAVCDIAHRLAPTTDIVLMVNGMGILEELQAQLPQLSFYLGTTTQGAYRNGPGQIRHAGTGTTRIGNLAAETAPAWFASWQSATEDCYWDDNIQQALWHKLAVNCAINPQTAMYGCLNGELAENSDYLKTTGLLCAEISQVLLALGHHTLAQELYSSVLQVIKGTANNRSSMLQDVTAGRATEINYITGHLLRTAESLGLELPLNRQMLRRIIELAH
jgi:2-dehydropantoate 2-reductase